MGSKHVYGIVCEFCDNSYRYIQDIEYIMTEENGEVVNELTRIRDSIVEAREYLETNMNDYKIIIENPNIYLDKFVNKLLVLSTSSDSVMKGKIDKLIAEIVDDFHYFINELAVKDDLEL